MSGGFIEQRIQGWERAVVLELMREHEGICRERQVELLPVSLRLNDSSTYWGLFVDTERVIYISRRLVAECSWHQVLGVLRHEMAHQWVAENDRQAWEAEASHGPSFQRACQKLGVPNYFTRATVHLQKDSLDWRTQPIDEKSEKILDKTRKLLALATSSSEHEAALAMNRVREIYARYNLDEKEISSRQGFVHLVLNSQKKRMEFWQQKIISLLQEHFFVKVLMYRQFDASTQEHPIALEIVGTRENVLLAEYVYQFLLQKVVLLVGQARGKDGERLSVSERKAYRLGILNGFSEKLKVAESDSSSVISRALTQFYSDAPLQEYLSLVHPRLRTKKMYVRYADDQAYRAGHQVGRSLNLHKPIENSSVHGGRLLGNYGG